MALAASGLPDTRKVKAFWIKNTLSCETVLASEAYVEELGCRSHLRKEPEPAPLAFDGNGGFVPVF
ncbi:MAG: hypothetical protein HZC54_13990 [Verrucomicrobia bacterium]|nr:hypothetical protein [Verrucomicrobiota bacterium]